jgi:tetratricopeptide (TPR) repeat protein
MGARLLQGADAPARLDPLNIGPEPRLELEALGPLVLAGKLEEAQTLCASWKYRYHEKQALPLLHLIARIYQLSLGAQVQKYGRITVLTPYSMEPPQGVEDLEVFYREASHSLLGRPPPPVRIHMVEELGGELHGVHFVGHIVVAKKDSQRVVRHELIHLLLSLHPGGQRLQKEWYWIQEGLAESLSHQGDPRLVERMPLRETLPDSLAKIFPRSGLWNPPAGAPGVDSMGALLGVRVLFGGHSPFTPGVKQFLDTLAGGLSPPEALQSLRGWTIDELDAHWLRRFREDFSLGEESPSLDSPWGRRAAYLRLALRGHPVEAARVLAGFLGNGQPPDWMLQDALKIGTMLGRQGDEAARSGLRELYRAVPLVGLVVPASLQDEDWASRVLDKILAQDPPPETLLYALLLLWNTPSRKRVEAGWAKGWAQHGEEIRWLQGEGIRLSYLGRLEPPEGGWAAVLSRLQRIQVRLKGREGQDPGMRLSLDEARAAFAFGAEDFGACEQILRERLEESGWERRQVLNLAAAIYRQGKYVEALKVYQQGLFLDPDYPGYRLGLGATLLALGRAGDARKILEAANAGNEYGARILATRAKVQRVLGDLDGVEKLEDEAAKRGYQAKGSPVPAEYQVMVFTQLEKLVADLSR